MMGLTSEGDCQFRVGALAAEHLPLSAFQPGLGGGELGKGAEPGRVGLMENHRYAVLYVERVRDRAAREFLTTVGLPSASLLFTADEAAARGREQGHPADREVVRLGYDVEGEGSYYVDCATSAVLYVEAHAFTAFHVSGSPRTFAECLAVFERKTSQAPVDAEREGWEDIAGSLRQSLAEIDPSTLRDDPGFWHSLLFDVAIGDYGDEEG